MWRVTHQVHLPTVALGLLWIVHSMATTMYVPWQNSRQRAAIASTVGNMDRMLLLHDQLTEWQSLAGTDTFDRQRSLQRSIATTLAELKPLVDDPQAEDWLTALDDHFRSIQLTRKSSLDGAAVTDLVEECQKAIRAQQQQLLEIVDERSRTDITVMIVRAVLLILGLTVGIGLAMWISRNLRRSLSEISVTLKGAEGDLQMDLGRIDIVSQGSEGELNLLESQVQRIVRNVRLVAEELQQARDEMVRAERLAAVGELAAGVAHEIRNPLTSVKLLVQGAAERHPVHSLDKTQVHVLLEEVEKIENTVQGLLNFARPEKSQKIDCPLHEILERTFLLLDGRIRQQHIRIQQTGDDHAAIVRGDPRLIQQVLVNLILNAIDFMPDGGDLIVRYHPDTDQRFTVIEVEDTGPGISPSMLGRLFEPFVTTRSNGSGLGLAISRRLIEEQGGTLVARNSACGGAIFSVRLPLAIPA